MFTEDKMTDDDYEFFNHIAKYNKRYETRTEFEKRANIFKGVLQTIRTWNEDPTKNHKLGTHYYSDNTEEEWKIMAGLVGNDFITGDYIRLRNLQALEERSFKDEANVRLEYKNWVEEGAVTPVENQGICGSCWAWSTAGAVEGAHKIKHGILQSFSVQQQVSCVPHCNTDCEKGCNYVTAYEYILNNPLSTSDAYPYTSYYG